MNLRTTATVAISTAALGAGLAFGGPATAAPASAKAVSDTAMTVPAGIKAPATAQTTHRARLWTQVGGGANGYADITHTYTAVGHGYYQGRMSGKLSHYYAPKNRQVVVMFRVDGTLGGYSKVTKSNNVSFNKTYSHFKRVSARICLHRSGVPIKLNSGVSYCSPWWG
ncbi:hypothetical protein ACLMNJ_15710 [Streptomyces seoulensis]